MKDANEYVEKVIKTAEVINDLEECLLISSSESYLIINEKFSTLFFEFEVDKYEITLNNSKNIVLKLTDFFGLDKIGLNWLIGKHSDKFRIVIALEYIHEGMNHKFCQFMNKIHKFGIRNQLNIFHFETSDLKNQESKPKLKKKHSFEYNDLIIEMLGNELLSELDSNNYENVRAIAHTIFNLCYEKPLNESLSFFDDIISELENKLLFELEKNNYIKAEFISKIVQLIQKSNMKLGG